MAPGEHDFLELASISPSDLGAVLPALNGYLKFASLVWIRALGQPTLDGIIVKRWSRKTAAALRKFCLQNGSTNLLLRVDQRHARWSARRGGYVIRLSEAAGIVRDLSKQDVITAMLEPASPYRDLYCLACVAIPEECRMVIEVVGPGFDTSDLLRSDLLPHERFEISLPAVDTATSLFPLPPATRTYLITQARYRESVEDRLGKVGAKAANPAFPSQVATDPTDLRDRARQLLMQTGETLLLRHGLRYHPIPKPLLRRFIAGVVEMLSGLERRAIRLGAVTFSGTFTTRKRLVYWDFFPADTKQGLRLFRAEA